MREKLKQLSDYEWYVPKDALPDMNVGAKIIGNKLLVDALEDDSIKQLTNVACLPGAIEPVVGMPDMHFGYGLPMGAVGVFDSEEGVISAGCTGFDINCGINLIRTNLTYDDVKDKLKDLIPALFKNIPCGVGEKGKLKLNDNQLKDVLVHGVNWAVDNGYGTKDDIKHLEENGCMKDADASKVSKLAMQRGYAQLGTLGSGNHFLEIQKVSNIFDEVKAKEYGLEKNQVVIMLHSGSRGLGHQVATDYLKIHEEAAKKYKIKLPDPQMVCAPVNSKEGEDYFKAMKCAVNYSFTNRLVITQWIRETFQEIYKKDYDSMDMKTVYGIAHNICKIEKHKVDGKIKEVYIHRKGSTRSFPDTPVLIAGSMGTASYVLVGTEKAMEKTFGSTCHGAGRALSRTAAIKKFWGETIKKELEATGKVIKATSPKVLAEEAPGAYKDIEPVIESVHKYGISLKVAKLLPLGVIKG